MKARFLIPGLLVLLFLLPAASAAEPDPQLQRALQSFLRGAEVLRIDAVPDLYEGGYARISIYAQRARVGNLIVEEVWIRLRGVTLSVPHLRDGIFRVVSLRESSARLRVAVAALQMMIQASSKDEVSLTSDGTYLFGRGSVPLGNRTVRLEMKGTLAVQGTPEIFLHLSSLRLNSYPVPTPIVNLLERRYNPIVDQKGWPVRFKLRSLRMTRDEFIVSSEADPLVCPFCDDVEVGR